MIKIYMFFYISFIIFSVESGVYSKRNMYETGIICKNQEIKNNEFCKEKIERSVEIPEGTNEKLVIYINSVKKEVVLIYKEQDNLEPQKLKLTRLTKNYYKSLEPLKIKGVRIGVDENGKTFVNTEVIANFNVIVCFEEQKSEILLYIDDGHFYSQNEYKFYRKLQDTEVEAIDSFDSNNIIWENFFDIEK